MKPYRTMQRLQNRKFWRINRPFWSADVRGTLFLVAAMAWVCSACSGYQKLSADYEAYQPPILAAVSESRLPESANRPLVADDFPNQQKKIDAMRAAWSVALDAPANDSRFYSPSPEKLTALEPAAGDEAKAIRSLFPEFSLETLQVLVLLRNPGVISAENAFRGKLHAYSQVLGLDEVLRQYAAFTQSVMTGVGSLMDKESSAMKFPFPGILALKGEIVNQEVIISRQVLETARKTAVSEARRLYWKLHANRRFQEITQVALSLLDQLELSARKRYEVGQETLQEVLRVQIQQIKLAEELRTLKEDQKTLHAGIRSLLDLHPSAVSGVPQSRDPRREVVDIDRISALASENSQELRTIRSMIGRMERMIEMAETEIYPPFTQNLSLFENNAVFQVGAINSGKASSDVSTGDGLPKNPWFGLEDAYLQETRENLLALRSDLKKAENDTRFKVRDGWFRLDQAIREERLYTKKITELSRLSSEVTALRYEAGVAELRDVIEFYMIWFDARLSGERKKAEIGITRANLEEIVGISF